MKLVMNLAITISEAGFWWLLTWSWQAAVLITGVWLGLRICRVQSAALRHQVWLLSLIAVVLLPIWSSIVQVFPVPRLPGDTLIKVVHLPKILAGLGASRPLQAAPLTVGLSNDGRDSSPVSIWGLLFMTWAAGVVIALLLMIRNVWHLSRICREARPAAPEDLDCGEGTDLFGKLECKSIRFHKLINSPILAGVWRPIVLLPTDIAQWTTAAERRAMIQHEIAHLARRDHYVNLFLRILKIVFYFHSLVSFACRQLEIEREIACDDQVIAGGTSAAIYAESILKAAGRNLMHRELHAFGNLAPSDRRKDHA